MIGCNIKDDYIIETKKNTDEKPSGDKVNEVFDSEKMAELMDKLKTTPKEVSDKLDEVDSDTTRTMQELNDDELEESNYASFNLHKDLLFYIINITREVYKTEYSEYFFTTCYVEYRRYYAHEVDFVETELTSVERDYFIRKINEKEEEKHNNIINTFIDNKLNIQN